MDLMLERKVAIVTGAGSGIGASIAAALANEGCLWYASDLRPDAARDTARNIGRQGCRATHLAVDVGDWQQVEAMVDTVVGECGRVDILVNGAGLLTTGSIEDSSIEDWTAVVRVNLSGTFYCSRAVLPPMRRQQGGKIVNIASVSAARGGGALGNTLYGTTKAGVVAMTKGFSREAAGAGVNVNAIAPGVVDTPLVNAPLQAGDVRSRIAQRTPAGRLGEAAEVALLATFLASDVCRYINGATIVIDGGFLTV